MAGAEIGGDTSVEWTVLADHVRTTPPNEAPQHGPQGSGGWRQHGKDETGLGAQSGFWITLQMPRGQGDAATFVNSLTQAAAAAAANQSVPGFAVSFTLPIENANPQQIQIQWDSLPLAAGHRPFAALAAKKTAKGKKKAAKKAPRPGAKKARKRAK
jgi:hypothetical protein